MVSKYNYFYFINRTILFSEDFEVNESLISRKKSFIYKINLSISVDCISFMATRRTSGFDLWKKYWHNIPYYGPYKDD